MADGLNFAFSRTARSTPSQSAQRGSGALSDQDNHAHAMSSPSGDYGLNPPRGHHRFRAIMARTRGNCAASTFVPSLVFLRNGPGRRRVARFRMSKDPKDTARRLLLARQRLLERASCSCEKPLLSARGTLQDVYGMNLLKDDSSLGFPKKNGNTGVIFTFIHSYLRRYYFFPS